MTLLFLEKQYFSVFKTLIAVCHFVMQSNYINETETKKKQRPAAKTFHRVFTAVDRDHITSRLIYDNKIFCTTLF